MWCIIKQITIPINDQLIQNGGFVMNFDFQAYVDSINGMAGIYSFDVFPDGSYSEIRLMAIRGGVQGMGPDAPKFYPGIPWRKYYTDLNFESYIYRCASSNEFLYSYTNAHGHWVKGFYMPMLINENETNSESQSDSQTKTLYCLYTGTFSAQFESDSMSGHSPEVAAAVTNISVKLHETQNYHQAMAATIGELQKVCGAVRCMLYTVDSSRQHCTLIDNIGVQEEYLAQFSAEMGRSPYEIAQAWENDLDDSDCLLLDDLSILQQRDPAWYKLLCDLDVKNIILYAVRNNQNLVGFILAANYDAAKMVQIKETLELTAFLISAVIANHQIVYQLELKSTIDGLTQLLNRNAMNERVDELTGGKAEVSQKMGVVLADLNGLKTVNDIEGHDAGDKLLIRAAALLKLAFGDYEIYRAGGDEFFAFCPGVTEEKLDQQVQQLCSLANSTPDVSFAVGSVYASGEYDIRNMMKTADERMYKDKQEFYRLNPEKAVRK